MDLNIRREYPIGRRVNDEPIIYVFDDFLREEEIDSILETARTKMQRAQVSFQHGGGESDGRTGSNCWIDLKHNATIAGLSKRVSELVGIPLENAESLQVIHYGLTQEYQAHYDAWEWGSESGERCMARGGQRLVTCLLYFNDVEEGGGTGFPELDIEVQARKGRMVLFHNVHPGTNEKHKKSLHGGLPVRKGEKWACNFWFRERDYGIGSKKKATSTASTKTSAKKGPSGPANRRSKGTKFKRRR